MIALLCACLAAAAAPDAPAGLPALRATAQEVARGPDFGTERVELVWRPHDRPTDPEEPSVSWRFAELLSLVVGRLLMWLVIGLGLAGLALLAVSVVRDRRRVAAQDAAATEAERPTALFGLDLRPETLPADVCSAALELWRAGDAPGALSLLYRGALTHLIDARHLRIPPSATEGECVGLVAHVTGGELAAPFGALTDAWLVTAYGHRPPADEAFTELVRQWTPLLRAAP